MSENNNSAEARRLIGIAEKFLETRDFNGAKEFAALAQEADPFLEGSEQISTIADVLLSAEKRVNNRYNWYSILQIEAQSNDQELIKRQYRRLALLLHPDKNKYPFSAQAFQLVYDAGAVLSDNSKKTLFDNELSLFSRVNLPGSSKLPVWRSPGHGQSGNKQSKSGKQEQKQQKSTQSSVKLSSFWTACPYCYVLYEYSRVYENCCLRCRSCERAYEAVSISQLPPLVPGKEAYYCCWGFFPLGFAFENQNLGENVTPANVSKPAEPPSGGFPSWMPPGFFPTGQQSVNGVPPVTSTIPASNGGIGRGNATVNAPKKRGRPRKNPLPT